MAAIQKENLRLKLQIEILKKAMDIFVKKQLILGLSILWGNMVQWMCYVLTVPQNTYYHSLQKTAVSTVNVTSCNSHENNSVPSRE
ncbi:hypothetical protein DN401_29405 [Bacillus sp. BF2-3]|nr:hypothetical protein DN401_29405 [Bacillus sp. BF2-3]